MALGSFGKSDRGFNVGLNIVMWVRLSPQNSDIGLFKRTPPSNVSGWTL